MVVGFSLLLAVIFAVLALAGREEKLPPNAFYGLRTSKTMGSDEAWFTAHRAAAPANLTAAGCFATTALASVFSETSRGESLTVVIGWTAGFLAFAVAIYLAHRAVPEAAE